MSSVNGDASISIPFWVDCRLSNEDGWAFIICGLHVVVGLRLFYDMGSGWVNATKVVSWVGPMLLYFYD